MHEPCESLKLRWGQDSLGAPEGPGTPTPEAARLEDARSSGRGGWARMGDIQVPSVPRPHPRSPGVAAVPVDGVAVRVGSGGVLGAR